MTEENEKVKQMQDFLDRHPSEDLDPELEMYKTTENGITMIRHPLVYSIMHHDFLNHMFNESLKHKKNAVKVYLREKEYGSYIFIHERPWRLQAFLDIQDKLSNHTYWRLLGSIWTDSENIWQNLGIWKHLLQSKRKFSHNFMTKECQAALKKLPNNLLIYRGCTPKNEKGLSWTLDEEKATWFATRFNKIDSKVISKTITKGDIFAYIEDRGEKEIILKPKKWK